MKVGFLTFADYHGRKEIGSSRIRAAWVAKYWEGAELYRIGAEYDVVIYQKVYWPEHAKLFKGIKILDLCDPDWMHWMYRFKEMIEEVDAITCSTFEIAKAVTSFTDKPVVVIPDRIDLAMLPPPKKHKGTTKNIVWYGYSDNFPMLDSAVGVIGKHNLNLIVISDKVYAPGASSKLMKEPGRLINLPWSDTTYMDDIQRGDVVINPRYVKGKWKYKSDNKTTLAQALGVPVAHTEEELLAIMGEQERITEANRGRELVLKDYDVNKSVQEFKELIGEIQEQKKIV